MPQVRRQGNRWIKQMPRLFGVFAMLIFSSDQAAFARDRTIPPQVTIESRFIEFGRNDIDHLGLSFELGSDFSQTNFALSGTFGPTPATQSLSTTNGFVGGDIRVPLTFVLSLVPLPAKVNGGAFLASPVLGVSARGFLNGGAEAGFDIHPAPSTPTMFSFQRNWSVTPYVGLPIVFTSRPVTLVVTPRVGPTFENVSLGLRIDERGLMSDLGASNTRTGFTVGTDFDFILPSTRGPFQPFIGIGAELTSMPDATIQGRSRFPFDYTGRAEGNLTGAIKARFGFLVR